ncbi:hypothetical protein GCM10010495_76790 [Kitasatospora herbaricolor]|nr:hypothetical protein GCM10010495_76790 [Kitasatospora herbaricolor]
MPQGRTPVTRLPAESELRPEHVAGRVARTPIGPLQMPNLLISALRILTGSGATPPGSAPDAETSARDPATGVRRPLRHPTIRVTLHAPPAQVTHISIDPLSITRFSTPSGDPWQRPFRLRADTQQKGKIRHQSAEPPAASCQHRGKKGLQCPHQTAA